MKFNRTSPAPVLNMPRLFGTEKPETEFAVKLVAVASGHVCPADAVGAKLKALGATLRHRP